eukprot:COSAG01_NODE_369_length_18046_cov_130.301443_20_plen_48_part_00
MLARALWATNCYQALAAVPLHHKEGCGQGARVCATRQWSGEGQGHGA